MSATLGPPETTPDDFTDFRWNILAVLSGGERYGLAIKRELEAYYGEDVTPGRLYPNLDWLEERGLITRSELDRRTNEYAITSEGEQALRAHHEWQRARLESEYSPGGGDE